jgi:hypothetical protein
VLVDLAAAYVDQDRLWPVIEVVPSPLTADHVVQQAIRVYREAGSTSRAGGRGEAQRQALLDLEDSDERVRWRDRQLIGLTSTMATAVPASR